MKDTILSLSGGLDSGSLLFEYKDRIKLAVSFDYGSNHNQRELEAAKFLTKKAGVEHIVVDLTETFKHISSALLEGADAVPNGAYDSGSVSACVVPFRNGIFLSILAGIADSNGCTRVALASHAGEHVLYKDCTPEFSDALNEAIKLGTEHHVEFFYPYIHLSKHEVAKRGIEHGLNPDWTYSCYKGTVPPCGKCPTCIERAEALEGLKW